MDIECDVLVAGSGAGGLAAAITARRHGLDVIVAEKAPQFGGTTALSGGWLWIPRHPMQAQIGVKDSVEEASTYLLHEAGEKFDPARINAFLAAGPRMVEWFQRETAVRFDPSATFADYHPDAPGGKAGGRSIVASAFDGRELGAMLGKLRGPLPELTFAGIMIGSGAELVHFMRWSKSLRSAAFVARRLIGHGCARLFHGRGVRLTNGNALAGRLLKAALDAGVLLRESSSVRRLIVEDGAVRGAIVELSALFGDKSVLESVRARLASTATPLVERRRALDLLRLVIAPALETRDGQQARRHGEHHELAVVGPPALQCVYLFLFFEVVCHQ